MTRVSVVVGLHSMSCVTSIVRAQLLPIVVFKVQVSTKRDIGHDLVFHCTRGDDQE